MRFFYLVPKLLSFIALTQPRERMRRKIGIHRMPICPIQGGQRYDFYANQMLFFHIVMSYRPRYTCRLLFLHVKVSYLCVGGTTLTHLPHHKNLSYGHQSHA
jgi:hypothetical protein